MIDARAQLFEQASTIDNAQLMPCDHAHYLALMNEFNISHAVLVQSQHYFDNNETLLSGLAFLGKKARGVAIVNPNTSLADLQTLQQQGVCAVHVKIASMDQHDWTLPIWQQFLDNLQETGLILSLEQSIENGLNHSLKWLKNYNINIIVEQLGQPNLLKGIHDVVFQSVLATCMESNHIWFDLSGYYQNDLSHSANVEISKTFTLALLKAVGSKRLLWGSDWPFNGYADKVSYRQSIAWLTNHVHVDDEVIQDLLHNNAQSLFGFDD